MAIILDLETLAADGIEFEPVVAPANYTKADSIAKYVAEAEIAQREKAGLHPYTCRILALGWCEEGDEIEHVEVCGSEAKEAAVLLNFWHRISDGRGGVTPLVTYNGLGFDLPVLAARSLLLGVSAPTLNLDRYRSPHPDLMQILTFRGAIQARSLKWFAKRFGLDVSDAFGGKEIAQLWEDQNLDAIKSHCASDVRLTRQLAEKLGVIKARPRVAEAAQDWSRMTNPAVMR